MQYNGADVLYFLQNGALQLTDRTLQCELILGVDHVDDGLCLGQINTSVQKCPLCKLSRFCRTGTIFKTVFQYFFS